MYRKGEYDLAGCIVGVVDRTKIIDGSKIRPNDVVLGLASNGLHTNGYSLARKILFEKMRLKPSSRLLGSTITVGEELLRVHKNYQPLLAEVPAGVIKGLAHITGGGVIDNLPRVLPPKCDAVIETKNWRVPSIFQLLQRNGNVDAHEMYQVFNMITAVELDDLVTPAERARQADARHRCFRATVHHPHLLDGGNPIADQFRHLNFQRIRNSKT